MILEAIEWLLTPSSLLARRSGLLAGQIAIRHRALRCRGFWHSHLQSTRQAIRSYLQQFDKPLNRVMVLGSGHLHDCDLHDLLDHAQRVVLVDIVHPVELYWHLFRRKDTFTLLTRDLSFSLSSALRGQTHPERPDEAFLSLLHSCDAVISLNLLSQLPLGAHDIWQAHGRTDQEIETLCGDIIRRHIELLQQCPDALLITDRVVRVRGIEKEQPQIGAWQDLLYGQELPPAHNEWIWTIASPQERGDAYWEERNVVCIPVGQSIEKGSKTSSRFSGNDQS